MYPVNFLSVITPETKKEFREINISKNLSLHNYIYYITLLSKSYRQGLKRTNYFFWDVLGGVVQKYYFFYVQAGELKYILVNFLVLHELKVLELECLLFLQIHLLLCLKSLRFVLLFVIDLF